MPTDRPADALCHIEELENPGSAGFAIDGRLVMVLRRGKEAFAYANSCPHVGAPLDFQPGRFLDSQRRFILCANHGALFRIDDGRCVAGPCAGKSLESVAITLTNGWVRLSRTA